jgi:hypothetical protein
MELLLIWLICPFVCAAIARSKRRSGVDHFFGGLFLGPLWVLVVGLMGTGGVPCPQCREKIDPGASVCPRCRADLRGATQKRIGPKRPSGDPPAPVEKSCPACFGKIDARATICRHCRTAQPAV